MPKILDRLPIGIRDDIIFLRDERIKVKAYETIVWISLSLKHVLNLPGGTPRFPAILDTAHTHNLSIQEQHLVRWAGLRTEMLHLLGNVRHQGRRLPLHAADVWIHRNEKEQRDRLRDLPPHRLILPRGIAVFPNDGNFPRLPLLGSRALVSNRLQFVMDGQNREASLHTPNWFTRLLRKLRLPPY